MDLTIYLEKIVRYTLGSELREKSREIVVPSYAEKRLVSRQALNQQSR